MTFGLEGTSADTTVKVKGVEAVRPFLELFQAHGHVEVDTARVYGNGDSEVASFFLPTKKKKS